MVVYQVFMRDLGRFVWPMSGMSSQNHNMAKFPSTAGSFGDTWPTLATFPLQETGEVLGCDLFGK